MEILTHRAIRAEWCGEPVEMRTGFAAVEMVATQAMAADERGLVHGGFVFGLADYAAMLAVNEPWVVLAKAETRFLKPVVAGEALRAEATLYDQDGPRKFVNVEVKRGGEVVMSGELLCYTPPEHVLDRV